MFPGSIAVPLIFGSDLLQSISLLIGPGIGTLIAIPVGMLDFSPVREAAVFGLVTISLNIILNIGSKKEK